jgi:hypothetical protein
VLDGWTCWWTGGAWTLDGRRCFLQSCSFQISSSLEPSVFWSYVFLFFSLRVECENEVEWNLSYWKVNFASFFFPCAVYFLIFWLILPGWVAVLRRICYCYFFFPFKSVVFAVDLQGYIYIFFKKKTRKKIIFVVRVEFF